MRPVMPRFLRPRLLLLPLVFGVLVAPAFLTTSAVRDADGDLHAGAMCKNGDVRPRKTETPRVAPNCVNCRAPLLNAPLARAPASERPRPPPAA